MVTLGGYGDGLQAQAGGEPVVALGLHKLEFERRLRPAIGNEDALRALEPEEGAGLLDEFREEGGYAAAPPLNALFLSSASPAGCPYALSPYYSRTVSDSPPARHHPERSAGTDAPASAALSSGSIFRAVISIPRPLHPLPRLHDPLG